MKKTVLFALAALFLPFSAYCQDLQVRKHDGISYISGGVGMDERAEMKAKMHDYNLLLTFAEKSGAYLADVEVVVRSVDGKKGFDAVSEGPFLYASLPPGKYKVSVEYGGKNQSRVVTLGRAHEVFYWK